MKKIFYLFLITGLGFISCNKPAEIQLEQDVIFKAAAFETGFKSGGICNNDIAHYAVITIQPLGGGSSFTKTVDIFYLNGKMFTNSLKLIPGDYEVKSFTLMNRGVNNIIDSGIATDDDIIVYASPEAGSVFGNLLNRPLPIPFTVGAFMKNEVSLDVICFEPADYDKFGFSWFAIKYNTVANNDMFFFGDICTKYFKDYEANNIYKLQMVNGSLSHDLIAIFEIRVYKYVANDWSLIKKYNNETTSMSGAPLIVPHPNTSVIGEKFKFELYILVKVGNSFTYKEFHSWEITDGAKIPSGNDNVIDFVLGSCVPDADLVLPPYMNLPVTATLTTIDGYPGSKGTYFDVTLSNIGLGFDIQNGIYGVYCGDLNTDILVPQTYTMKVYSSLYPALVPGFVAQKLTLDNINWLGNNLYRYPTHTWKDFQNAVWLIIGQLQENQVGTAIVGLPTALAKKMKNDANLFGNGYLPPVGGYAAVLFVSPTATAIDPKIQLLFTLVDP